MGKKTKLGKFRKDKFYKLAKETGFRSRAAFKLIQLNRRFGFLQQSQVCIDLCAAPGGWMQVAKQNMPVSSIVVGVDLFPIKPIPGCIALTEDITTDKCKQALTRELKTWKADVVLHDGAPNVGKNWLFDAYQQICLTLNALKLSTNYLKSGGWFITKVFRSKDYNALMWVLKQLFKKVHATKPSASRKESAEIFVVCQGYINPDKIDPKMLDPKYVFEELDLDGGKSFSLITNDKKRIKAEGYSDNDFSLRHELPVSAFIAAENALEALNGIGEIVFDEKKFRDHPKTTAEIVECCKDIKVLGRKDVKNLLSWWKSLHEEFHPDEKKAKGTDVEETPKPLTEEEQEDNEFDEVQKHIADMEMEEMKSDKRKKKKAQKMRTKLNEKLNLKMVLKYDEGPKEEADGMFNIRDLDGVEDVSILDDQNPDTLVDSDVEIDSFKPKFQRYDAEKSRLADDGNYYDDGDEEDLEMESDVESDHDGSKEVVWSDEEEKKDKKSAKGKKKDKAVPKKEKGKNPLIESLDNRDKDTKRRQRVQLWFEKDTLKNIDDNEDEDYDLDKMASQFKKKGVKILGEEKEEAETVKLPLGKKARRRARHADKKENDKSSDEESSDDEAAGADSLTKPPPKKVYKLTEEELALGSLLVSSKKIRRDLVDSGWNRYAFNDENLPDWFVRDEENHMRKDAPVPAELVEEYRKKQDEVNIRPIKKVMEAKARRKRRTLKRLEKAKKKTEGILENADASAQEKMRQIKKLYKGAEDKKKEVTYVVARKYNSGKRMRRPPGVKGQYKVVDPRLKKDTRAKKVIQKRMKKRK